MTLSVDLPAVSPTMHSHWFPQCKTLDWLIWIFCRSISVMLLRLWKTRSSFTNLLNASSNQSHSTPPLYRFPVMKMSDLLPTGVLIWDAVVHLPSSSWRCPQSKARTCVVACCICHLSEDTLLTHLGSESPCSLLWIQPMLVTLPAETPCVRSPPAWPYSSPSFSHWPV